MPFFKGTSSQRCTFSLLCNSLCFPSIKGYNIKCKGVLPRKRLKEKNKSKNDYNEMENE